MGTLALSLPKDWTPTYAETQILKKQSCWRPPTYIGFQAPVPPPPDYSTPAKVNARIREFCGTKQWLPVSDKTFAKALKDFRAHVEPLRCRVEDTHTSKWEVGRGCVAHEACTPGQRSDCVDGWTLRPRRARVIVTPDPGYRPAGHWTRRGGAPKSRRTNAEPAPVAS